MSNESDRSQTFGEEVANTVTHGLGALALCLMTPLLVLAALRDGGARAVVGASIFAGTAILLYLASTFYHAAKPGRWKQRLMALDHSGIFFLIAGTYTPFSLGALRGGWGWSLFGVVWGLAIAGIALEAFGMRRHRALSVGLHLTMGWLVLIAIVPLVQHVPPAGLALLVCGGASYTIGVAFYAAKRLLYAHAVWHLFVLMGTACHFMAVMHYAV